MKNGLESEFLYLITTGRRSGKPHQIEIWFVEADAKLYVLAEHFHKTQWVKNIQSQPRVKVRLAGRQFGATARVLAEGDDSELWQRVQQLAREKYDWGDGLPVEISPDEPLR